MDDKRRLSEKQYLAIDLILQGLTDEEVASQIGVARQTVNKWKNKNTEFIIELNRRRQEIHDAAKDKLIRLASKAIDTLEQEVEKRNWKVALEILKMAGLDYRKGISFGPTSEEDIKINKFFMKELGIDGIDI